MAKSLKTNYSIQHQIESFFTGTTVQFDQSGEHFYCAHGSNVNKVSVKDGQVKAQISTKDEEDGVIKFTVTPNDKLIIIAYHSGLITKFNLDEDTVEREFKSIHSAPITYLRTNPSATLLATGSTDGTIKLWNLKNHFCSHNLKGVHGVISCIIFLEIDQKELLFCSAGDDCVYVFDLSSNKRIAKLSTHCSTVTDLKFTPDKKKLISIGRDKIAVVWDISQIDSANFGSIIRVIPLYESVESLAIFDSQILEQLFNTRVKDGNYFFTTIGEEGLIKFWDMKSGSRIISQNEKPLSSDRSPGVHCFQLCPINNGQICVVSTERDLFIYDLPKLNLTQQLQGHIDEILSACWFAHDKYLAMACNSSDLKIINVATSKTQHLKGHEDIILCVKSVPSSPYSILTSSKDCTVIVWKFDSETMSPRILYRATGHTHCTNSIAVLNTQLIFFSGGEDTTLKRWSFRDYSPDVDATGCNGKEIALGADFTIKAHDERIDDISVSPNDQIVATGSKDKTAKIFSVEGLKILGTLRGHRRGVYSVKFSPVDQVVVTAADVSLRMWNLQDFSCVKTFQGHDCAVLNFSFLSSGLQILSIGSDGNMKLWDCKTKECTKTIDAHSGSTWALSMTCDDCMVVTGGQDEKLIIWRDSTQEEKQELLAQQHDRVLNEQEFSNSINKKKWQKALNVAIKLESKPKTLNVMQEIFLEPNCEDELKNLLINISLDKINFIVECCVSWNAVAKSSSIAQRVLNILIRELDNASLEKIPGLMSSMDRLVALTQKSHDRYERLVQQAYFVDFFMKSIKIQ